MENPFTPVPLWTERGIRACYSSPPSGGERREGGDRSSPGQTSVNICRSLAKLEIDRWRSASQCCCSDSQAHYSD